MMPKFTPPAPIPPKPTIEPRWVWVTKELAQRYLDANHPSQRNRRPTNYMRLVHDMNNGEWEPTHQGIAFNVDGQLVDGQNRLFALIKSKLPGLWMLVSTGLSRVAMKYLDRNQRRTQADQLKAMGFDVGGQDCCAVAKVMMAGPTSSRDHSYQSDSNLLAVVKQFIDAIRFAQDLIPRTLGTAVIRGLLARAYYTVPHDKLKQFALAITDRLPASETREIEMCVRKHYQIWRSKICNGQTARVEQYQRYQTLLLNYVAGTPINNLRPSERDHYPIPPIDALLDAELPEDESQESE